MNNVGVFNDFELLNKNKYKNEWRNDFHNDPTPPIINHEAPFTTRMTTIGRDYFKLNRY